MFNKLSKWFSHGNASIDGNVKVYAPIGGRIVPLEQVPDPVFSQKMLGDGLAIEPASSKVLAPFDGTVAVAFPTGHAIGLRSRTGLECLIHIGIDTVNLQGQGFRLLVEQGQTVKQGTPLIELDLGILRQSGKSLITPVAITSGEGWRIEQQWEGQNIAAGKEVLFVARTAV